MKRYSITSLLSALFAAILIPLGLSVVLLIAQLQNGERKALETRMLRDVKSVVQAVEPVIAEMLSTLSLVTSTQELEAGDFRTFHARTQFALRETGNFIIVVDAEGRQLLNTRVPYGEHRGFIADLGGLQRVLETAKPQISSVFFGHTAQKWVFNVMKPLPKRNTTPARAVITTKNAEDLGPALSVLNLPERWQAVVIAADGKVVISSDQNRNSTGEPLRLPEGASLQDIEGDSGTRNVTNADGRQLLAFARIDGTDWRGVIWGPVATAQESILKTWYTLIIGGLVFMALSMLSLYFISRQLTRGVAGIVDMARRLGEGTVVSPVTSRIIEFDIVAKALADASFDRSKREDTLTFVMRELAHRTKNLIAVIISMVRQTAKGSDSVGAMSQALTNRMMGLGHSIDLLTAKDWGGVPLSELLSRQLSAFGKIDKSVFLNGPEVLLRAEAVQHLGMALHELATNAVKYGGLSKPGGRLFIDWEILPGDEQEMLLLSWKERGGPLAEAPAKRGFGTTIIERHTAAAFRGKTELDYSADGFNWTLTAPLAQLIDPDLLVDEAASL